MLTTTQATQFAQDLDSLERSNSELAIRRGFDELEAKWLNHEASVVQLELFYGALATSTLPEIRSLVPQSIQVHLPSRWVRDIICGLCVDPEDIVCMAAMRLAGDHGLQELAPYFMEIIGKPSESVDSSVCPVGRGASIVRRALTQLLYEDPYDTEALARAESALEGPQALTAPDTAELADQFDYEAATEWLLSNLAPSDDSMVLVPGGYVRIGLDEDSVPSQDFAWERGVPETRLWIPPYLIDRAPVTNEAYDAWVNRVEQHETCHAMEPEAKDHRRNTALDPRLGPQNPATGIDWFDAESFARAHGKSLPTEIQWEAAARGSQNSIWPWGRDWDSDKAWHFKQSFGFSSEGIREWRNTLEQVVDRSWPSQSSAPVDRAGVYENDYGVRDASGNCWEWTSTELRTRGPFSPTIERFLGGHSSVVLKGGCWSSLPGQLYPSFRGQDAAFCRHDEIGFRCVVNLPSALIRKFASLEASAPLPAYLY